MRRRPLLALALVLALSACGKDTGGDQAAAAAGDTAMANPHGDMGTMANPHGGEMGPVINPHTGQPSGGMMTGGAHPVTGTCAPLTAEQVSRITGVQVKSVAKDEVQGAGGTCGNFVREDRNAIFLIVSALAPGAAGLEAEVATMERTTNGRRQQVPGVGDDAYVVTLGGKLRALAAHRGDTGFVVTTFDPVREEPTTAQLAQLMTLALGGK